MKGLLTTDNYHNLSNSIKILDERIIETCDWWRNCEY